MARLTISLPDTLAVAATQRASEQKRSASSYVALLIEQDVQAHAVQPPDAELIAQLEALLGEDPELRTKLHRLVMNHRRKMATAAA